MKEIISNYSLFHLVQQSGFPLFVSLSMMGGFMSLVYFIYTGIFYLHMFFMSMVGLIAFFWFRDVFRESYLLGKHYFLVQLGFKTGMLLFIFSEFMLFLSFFWSFFHSSLSSSVEIGLIWPPYSVVSINSFEVPLLNTFVLLSSSITVTYSHFLMISDTGLALDYLVMTVILGVYFSVLQLIEYMESSFSIMDGFYGSIFFCGTGFHGLHVMVGTTFLFVCLLRMLFNYWSFINFISYELAIWYWHFVDVIWLFLFSFIYWWGGYYLILNFEFKY